MKLNMSIEFDSIEELARVVGRIQMGEPQKIVINCSEAPNSETLKGAIAEIKPSETAEEEPKRAKTTKAKAAEPVKEEAAAEPPKKLKLDDVREALQMLISENPDGMEAGRAMLAKFGVKRLSELPPEVFDGFYAECRAGVNNGK